MEHFMDMFFGSLAILLVGGLFAKHISFILMFGSVFDGLRHWIKRGMQNTFGRKQWGFKKLHELITCELCMTAQVSIWTVALPIMIILSLRFGGLLSVLTGQNYGFVVEFLAFLFAWFVIAISNATSAMALWQLTEHLPSLRKELERHNRAKEQTMAAMAIEAERHNRAKEQQIAQPNVKELAISYEEFLGILQGLQVGCGDIACGYRRRDCRVSSLETFVGELAESKGLSYGQQTRLNTILGLAGQLVQRLRHEVDSFHERARRAWEEIVKPELINL